MSLLNLIKFKIAKRKLYKNTYKDFAVADGMMCDLSKWLDKKLTDYKYYWELCEICLSKENFDFVYSIVVSTYNSIINSLILHKKWFEAKRTIFAYFNRHNKNSFDEAEFTAKFYGDNIQHLIEKLENENKPEILVHKFKKAQINRKIIEIGLEFDEEL